MLMHPHRGAVDHLHVAVVSLGDCGQNAVPDPGFAPPHEAVVAGCARTELLRQRPPRRARSQHPEDPVQHPTIIDSWNPARFVRQQRRDHSPLEIRQLVSPHNQKLPQLGSLNQKTASVGIPFMSSRPSPRQLACPTNSLWWLNLALPYFSSRCIIPVAFSSAIEWHPSCGRRRLGRGSEPFAATKSKGA